MGPTVEQAGATLAPTSSFRGESRPVGRRNPSAGFTLIELVVVLVIVGIGAALVAPAVTSGIRAREVRSGVRTLLSSCRDLQSEAVRTGTVRTLVIDPVENELFVEGTKRRFSLGEVVRLSQFEGVLLDAEGMARVRFYPNGGNSGLGVLIDDAETPEDLGYVFRLDPLIGSVEVFDEGQS